MSLKNLLQVIVIILLSSSLEAQITGVNYRLKFNEKTNLFDCYLIIKDGRAKNMRHRAQFNAQYTVLVPHGSRVEMAKSYMPLQNNQDYNGIKPMDWVVSNKIKKPAADPFYDYISIVPTLSPVSFYNDLNEGDEILLFSLNILPITDCGASVKIYEHGIDLNSGERGMAGGDFSNGFTIGGVEQKYQGNAPQLIPSLSVVKQIHKSENQGISLTTELITGLKSNQLSFEWQYPSGYKSDSKDIVISKPGAKDYGTYKLVVTDERGCKEFHNIEVQSSKSMISGDLMAAQQIDLIRSPESREKTSNPNENFFSTISESVKIYPNPAQNFVFIHLEANAGSKVKADLTDVNGRIIRNNILNTDMTADYLDVSVPLQELTPGIYNIVVRINEKESSHRLIVVK